MRQTLRCGILLQVLRMCGNPSFIKLSTDLRWNRSVWDEWRSLLSTNYLIYRRSRVNLVFFAAFSPLRCVVFSLGPEESRLGRWITVKEWTCRQGEMLSKLLKRANIRAVGVVRRKEVAKLSFFFCLSCRVAGLCVSSIGTSVLQCQGHKFSL